MNIHEDINDSLQSAEVVVCGGGLSGCLAAIASARTGAKTVLLERAGMLGGIASTAFVNSMTNMFFTGKDKQIIQGIPAEIIEAGVMRGCISPHWKTNEYRQIRFELEEFHQILLDKLWEANVRIYTHTWATDAILDGTVVKGVNVQTRAGKKKLYSKVVVDCTGDLDVINSCGPDETINDAPGSSTLLFELWGVDMQKAFEFFIRNPENYNEHIAEGISLEGFKRNWEERGLFHLQHGGGRLIKPLQDAIARGEYDRESGISKNCDAMGIFGTKESGKLLVNSNFFIIDEFDSLENYSYAELSARKICMNLFKTLKRVLPGFDTAVLTHIGTELGCRKTRYLKGKYTIDNVNHAQEYNDVVGVVPVVDTHSVNGFFGDDSVDIPYRALIPKTFNRILVGTGKGMSAEWPGRTFLRYMPICMLVGQAAGTAAALAALNDIGTQELDIHILQGELMKVGVWLGNEKRLNQIGLAKT